MKIIDQTPYYKEDGTLGLMDRARAILEFGTGWMKEVEAQKSVITVLTRALDKNFTLLHNVTPPGLGIRIPLILVGPTGVYVLGINPFPGLFSARGDQWGIISGGTLKPEKPNLMNRTERIARAIQVYLQGQGYSDLSGVEAVLLCSDPAANVDSVRPVIRVVMRDAFERFAVSIAQGRVVLRQETVPAIVERLVNPPPEKPAEPVETGGEAARSGVSLLPDSAPTSSAPTSNYQVEQPAPEWLSQPVTPPFTDQQQIEPAEAAPQSEPVLAAAQSMPPARKRAGITGKQWAFLVVMLIVWLIIMAVFAYLIARDFLPH
jgi:hypothetical protein